MGSSTALTDPSALLVADASAIINLIATGSVREILSALPNRVMVVDAVPGELETGRSRGREACDRLKELTAAGALEIVDLGEEGQPYFESLVIGPAVTTLDDGEAATIAYAVAHGAIPLIDERKATRICASRHPQLRIACTVDVLLHPEVQRHLGVELLSEAVFRALRDGRMAVLPQHLGWIVGMIGEDRAAVCPSLPRRARVSQPPS